MTQLLLGLVLFAGVHLVPSMAPGVKTAWQNKLGEGGYKGTFSGLLLLSFALMIMGWRGMQAEVVYLPWAALRFPALALAGFAFLLFVVSNRASRLRLWIRHPQLTGVLLWALAHLLMNGDSRSLVLFSGMALWSCAEMIAINIRDGVWVKDEAPSMGTELLSLVITVVVIAVVIAIHPYISGMPVV